MRDKYFLQISHEWLKDSVLKCDFAFHRMISFKQTISVTKFFTSKPCPGFSFLPPVSFELDLHLSSCLLTVEIRLF